MDKMKNLLIRAGSGAVFVALTVLSILWSPYVFAVVFLLYVSLGVYEFHKITNHFEQVRVETLISVIGASILFLSAFLHVSGFVSPIIFGIYAFYLIGVIISELFRKQPNPVHNWAYFMLGQILVALPFALLNYIVQFDGFQPYLMLPMFITLWVNDTGAYVSGMLLGKHKLFERVSPKKTWEGFFGGMLFTVVSSYIFSMTIPDILFYEWLIFSGIVVILGTLGDLTESLLKRTADIKDAGNIIPGHGGVLDRFDSMLLVAPAILVYLHLILD